MLLSHRLVTIPGMQGLSLVEDWEEGKVECRAFGYAVAVAMVWGSGNYKGCGVGWL